MADQTFWTLEYDGTETSFADLGYTDPRMTLRSRGMGEFTVRVPAAALTAAPSPPFEGQVIIRRGRVAADGGYSQGSVVFMGYRLAERRVLSPDGPCYEIPFGDAWYALERLVYQVEWVYKELGQEDTSNGFYSRVLLFQGADGDLVDTGVQMKAVVDYASACGVPVAAGAESITVDSPVNVYPVRAVMCSDVIEYCLQPSPDASTWLELSTDTDAPDPPVFRCAKRSELAAVSRPYKGPSDSTSDITPRYDLQAPAVVVQYQKSWTLAGRTWTDFFFDKYPPTLTDAQTRVPRAVVLPIDLRGGYRYDITVSVVAYAANLTAAGGDYSFWTRNKPDLSNVTGLTMVGTPTVVDENGSAVNTSVYTNQYYSGQILGWMTTGGNPVLGIVATVTGKFHYTVTDSDGRARAGVDSAEPHEVSVRVVLTNSPVGETVYSTTTGSSAGEEPVTGLAHAIYDACSELHWEGQHTMVESDANGRPWPSLAVTPGTVLNLTGGATAWASMKAVVQQLDVDFTTGVSVASFGPPGRLSPGDIAELMQMWRYRNVGDDPAIQIQGYSAGGTTVALGGVGGFDNTSAAVVPLSLDAARYRIT